jgi:HK97 family phage portal protein
MGLFAGQRVTAAGRMAQQRATGFWGIAGAADLIPPRPFLRPGPVVTNDTALRHSAVWACLRTRADLISSLPAEVYRQVTGIEVSAPRPPVLDDPAGDGTGWNEWCYSTEFDLDRAGNVVGIITKRDGFGFPAAIELQDTGSVTVKVKDGRINKFKIGTTMYDPENIWHEKQHTVPGMLVGLSPVAYARWAIGEYLTVQEFATDWFGTGAVPKAMLKNKAKILSGPEISTVKEAWRAALATDEPFVTGSDWDYQLLQSTEASADWIEAKKFSIADICRFFGCPAEIIDAAPTGETRAITYSNISQKNLELLILHLGPAIRRREAKISRGMLPAPRYMRLNEDELMRLDPISRAQVIAAQVASKVLAPAEARAMDNRPPFTAAQIAEIDHFFPPAAGTAPAPDTGAPSAGGEDPQGGIPAAAALAREVFGRGALERYRHAEALMGANGHNGTDGA